MLYVIVTGMQSMPVSGLYGPFDKYGEAEAFIKKHLNGWTCTILRPMSPTDMTLTKG